MALAVWLRAWWGFVAAEGWGLGADAPARAGDRLVGHCVGDAAPVSFGARLPRQATPVRNGRGRRDVRRWGRAGSEGAAGKGHHHARLRPRPAQPVRREGRR